jgi:hypothetical protein
MLDRWYGDLRLLAGGVEGGDVPSFRLRDVIEQTITAIRQRWSLHGAFAEALRQYALARANGETELVRILTAWFKAHDIGGQPEIRRRLRDVGLREPISRRNAKEMLRALSVFLRYRGFGGILILIDEVENVLQQTPSARRTAYTVLRELIDNVDDRFGMTRAAFYVSATPDLFDGAKGITEYEALASRVLLPDGDRANPVAPVVDLSAFPLSREDFSEIAARIIPIHAIAGGWTAGADIPLRLEKLLSEQQTSNPDLTVRLWVRAVIETLDRIRLEAA